MDIISFNVDKKILCVSVKIQTCTQLSISFISSVTCTCKIASSVGTGSISITVMSVS